MIINDISYVKTILENNNIQGGFAIAEAFSDGYAVGNSFASTLTFTSTSVYLEIFGSRTLNSASSRSRSQSASAS